LVETINFLQQSIVQRKKGFIVFNDLILDNWITVLPRKVMIWRLKSWKGRQTQRMKRT